MRFLCEPRDPLGKSTILPRLQDLTCGDKDPCDDYSTSEYYWKMAILSSLRTVTMRKMGWDPESERLSALDESSVESLILDSCCIPPKTFSYFLRPFKHLRSFTWDEKELDEYFGRFTRDTNVDVHWLCFILQLHAKDTLEELLLICGNDLYGSSYLQGSTDYIENISAFTCLRHLYASMAHLCGSDEDGKTVLAVLPTSLQHLEIYMPTANGQEAVMVLEIILDAKSNMIPKLQKQEVAMRIFKDCTEDEVIRQTATPLELCIIAGIDTILKLYPEDTDDTVLPLALDVDSFVKSDNEGW